MQFLDQIGLALRFVLVLLLISSGLPAVRSCTSDCTFKLIRKSAYKNHQEWSSQLPFSYYQFRARYLGISFISVFLFIDIWVRDDSLQRLIKFTKELVPIPAGSGQDVNKMLGPVELVPSKSASNISLMILLLEIFGRYLPQDGLPPQKSCFLVFSCPQQLNRWPCY